jgi:hypothetical protein
MLHLAPQEFDLHVAELLEQLEPEVRAARLDCTERNLQLFRLIWEVDWPD